ncbi:unnamed protein product, partial [Rotaria sordida]
MTTTSTGRARFFDLMHETGDKLSSFKNYQRLEEPLLEEAIIQIQQHRAFNLNADIQNKVSLAKEECSKEMDVNNLTVDERAAIRLYTIESKIEKESLFYIVNSTLRLPDRSELKPILLYLRLFIAALEKLPSFYGLVYRGVNGNISSNFVKGKKLTWWGFSSCTRSLKVLNKDEFLGENGQRTLFYIECMNGKLIENYSSSSSDDEEVLLLPGTEFLVTGKKRANRLLTIIHLKEIPVSRPAADEIKIISVSVNEMTSPEEVDFRDEAKEKICGHYCNLWATRQCCKCSDRRPYQFHGFYEKYVDGIGFVQEALRNEYYCPT